MKTEKNINSNKDYKEYNGYSYALNVDEGWGHPPVKCDKNENYDEYETDWVNYVEQIFDLWNQDPEYQDLNRFEIMDIILKDSVEAMVEKYDDLRVIDDESDINNDENLIEFSVAVYSNEIAYTEDADEQIELINERKDPNHEDNRSTPEDYSYDFGLKVKKDGDWMEKIGGEAPQETYSWRDESKEAIIHNLGSLGAPYYDGEVVLLAKKKIYDL